MGVAERRTGNGWVSNPCAPLRESSTESYNDSLPILAQRTLREISTNQIPCILCSRGLSSGQRIANIE